MSPSRHSLLLCLSLLGLPAGLTAATGLDRAGQLQAVAMPAGEAFSFVRLDQGVQLRVAGVTKNVLFYGPDMVRVSAHLGKTHTQQPSLVVVASAATLPFTLEDAAQSLTIVGGKLRIVADKRTGALAFFRADGRELTRERNEQPATLREVMISGEPSYEISHSFTLDPRESLYGLGQYNRPYMDYRGQEVLMVQTNIGTVVPFLLSTRRYGILWDIYSKMTFRDDATGATLWAESAPAGVDYYLVAGDDMDGVIAGYRTLTGAAPMFPKQAFGLFMSKERYKTQDRLIEVVKRFREEGFPLDYIVQDWQYWGEADGSWSGMTWTKDRYPDPKGLTRTLHDELHVKLMNSIWPSVGNDTALAAELDAKGLRFPPLHWISKKARIYDAFSAEGRAIYFKHIRQGLLDVGVDALWMDGTEVEVGGARHDAGEVERDIKQLGRNALGDFTRYLNPYSLVTTQGTYEGQRALTDKRVLTLTRSAWAGQQRYAAMPWSGDTTASWETLRQQISGGINIAMAGLPYWTQDTGGFFVNYPSGERDPEYQELYARWNQFAIFNPIYRIHGTNIEREPYLFKTLAPEIYRSLHGAARLRYSLLPYLYSLAWQSTASSYTMMRGLPMDFPDDPLLRKTDDVFMFGPAFLVHPVTRAMYHVSLPPAPTIPLAVLRTPEGRPGLAVQYFEGTDFNRAAGSTTDEKLDHTWPAPPLANPPPGLTGVEQFSARWEGALTASESGEHELGVEYDDGARLYLDGRLLLEDWSFGPKRYRGAKVSLVKGQSYPLKVEFHQGAYARAFRLCLRTPSQLSELAGSKRELDNRMSTLLPAGSDWYDFWTGRRHAGGQTVTQHCDLGLFPVYVRSGSIVPMGPEDLNYATERPEAPYTVRIYTGANGRFTIYEDDNETYAYEKGERATYDLVWDDAARTLHVGPRQGAFPGMVRQRQLEVVLVGTALDSAQATRSVRYEGTALDVKFP